MISEWPVLPWHRSLWDSTLVQMCAERLSHAYLLCGMQGVGKAHYAKALSAKLLCLHQEGAEACGHCKECALIAAGTHPDLLTVEPESEGKPIKIDQVRKVNEFARKTAQQGGRRVVILNPAEAMNVNAANALLKSLEEPGRDTVFLLISARMGDMLPTIRSRCQRLSFATPPLSVSAQWLSEHIADEAVVRQLLTLSAGAPLSAQRLFDAGALEVRGRLINAVADLFRGDVTPVELAKTWQGENVPQLLEWLVSWLEDVIKMSLAADDHSIRNHDLMKIVRYVAGKAPVSSLVRLRDAILEQRQMMLGGANLNAQILLEGVFSRYLGLVV